MSSRNAGLQNLELHLVHKPRQLRLALRRLVADATLLVCANALLLLVDVCHS